MKTRRRKDRRLCSACQERRAVFRNSRGRMVTAGDGHDLCPACHRATRNSTRHA